MDGDPRNAYDELTALAPFAPESLAQAIVLNRGLALYQMRRYQDAIHVLEPLTSGSYKFAIPSLYHLSKSYRVLANAIDPTITKTITEKKRVGNVKVKVGKGKNAKTVTKPKIVTVKRTVKLVDAAKKATKDEYERLSTERLKDLLQLPLSRPVRLEVLNTLIAVAEAKDQDDIEQQLIRDVVKIDPPADPGLQHFWGKAWAAFVRGDLETAKSLLRFLGDTYTNPNVKRQADYWYARSIERQGQKEEARAVYDRLASAPYLDLYAIHSVARGAKHEENHTNPLNKTGPDWREIAEKEMPKDLRLAYELTALSDLRDARVEIQKNMTAENDRFSQALLAEHYNSAGSPVLTQRAVKRAFPQIATVEQDSAPAYFLKMYYPVKYQDAIKKVRGAQRHRPVSGDGSHPSGKLVHSEREVSGRRDRPDAAHGSDREGAGAASPRSLRAGASRESGSEHRARHRSSENAAQPVRRQCAARRGLVQRRTGKRAALETSRAGKAPRRTDRVDSVPRDEELREARDDAAVVVRANRALIVGTRSHSCACGYNPTAGTFSPQAGRRTLDATH